MFPVFISRVCYLSTLQYTVIAIHTASSAVTFKNDLLGCDQQNGKNKRPFGVESQCHSCTMTKLVHELFPLESSPSVSHLVFITSQILSVCHRPGFPHPLPSRFET